MMNESHSTCTYQANRWLLTIALCIYFTNVYAQQPRPADTIGAAYAESLTKSYSLRNEAFLASLKNETGDKKLLKYYQTHFKDIYEALHVEIKDRQMADIPEIRTALEDMVKEIQRANPIVPQDISVILVRDNNPNAFTLGDNTVFVNTGLFLYLENEDQVAGVLSHEIGHMLSKHTIKALTYSFDREKETTEEVRSIAESRYKKADMALASLKTLVYNNGKSRRNYEMQADSVGYALFKKTRYTPAAFPKALKIVDRYDTIRADGLLQETYKRFFDLPMQKFNEAWMKKDDFTSYNYSAYSAKFDKDSMASHPDAAQRVAYLTRVFPELKQENTDQAATEAFKNLKNIADTERIRNLYIQEKYGEAVYMALLQLQDKPNDNFYRNWLGKSFQKIYEARQEYKLNKYLDQIAPKDQSESYMQFLSFMWNLKVDELRNIAGYYYRAN